MKLMSMKQYSKMTKASLVRKIMKALKKLPKTKLIKLCYELEKRRLPTISTTKKNMPRLSARRAYVKPRRSTRKPRRTDFLGTIGAGIAGAIGISLLLSGVKNKS